MRMPSRALEGAPAAPASFRAPSIAPRALVTLAAPVQAKSARATTQEQGPIRIADEREVAKAASVESWSAIPGGFVARFTVTSQGAQGIRAKLVLGTVPGAFDVRVQGSDGAPIEAMRIDPELGNVAWTPWTEGATQLIELFSAVLPSPGAVSVAAIAHFTDSPYTTKAAAGTCTVSTMCSTNDPTIDAAIRERKKSIARMVYSDNGSQFLCTGTLLNSPTFPAPFFITANHCINNANAAASLTTFWFYESTACDGGVLSASSLQRAGGAQIVFTNYNVDSTLVRLNDTPPPGVVYSAWNRAVVAPNTPFVSLSHPKGDTARLALGTVGSELRISDRPQDMYGVNFTRGIIQGGSSGSGLFVLNGSSLELRGVLSGSTVRNSPDGLSCTDLDEQGIYSRFEIFEPEIDPYLHAAAPVADDAPNRALDLFNAPITDPNGVDKPLDLRGSTLVLAGKKIDYAGDVDVFRFRLAQQSSVHAWSTGTTDTVGAILDSNGVNLEANDDEDVSAGHTNFNFGITRSLPAGTYYVQVAHFDATGTGAYTLNLNATASAANYTDLWWNAQESGWGLNLNHQGSVIFGTLFTYDASGVPMWLVMPRGDLQADGSFSGPLYRTTGPAFNAVPFSPTPTSSSVGTMRVSFANSASGTLTYTFNGTSVTKAITQQVFSSPPSCTFTTGDRSTATNYQDLWWNDNESGWGVNVTHQGDILFATLFTYDASGQGKWFVMPNGPKTGAGAYSGALYATTGPAFNASPWVPAQATSVGTMSFTFTSGNSGTLAYSVNGITVTKAIQRETFSSPTTQCQ
ncbi:MAG: trypsin-like peptidase domain-containing protein [Usitatibacter sp.]